MLRLTLLDVLVEVEADDIGCVGVGGSRWLLFVGGGGLKRGLWCSRWCDGGGNRLSYRMVTVIMVVVNVVVVGFRSRSQKEEGNLLWMMTNKSPLIIRVQIAQKLLNTTVEVPVSKRSSIFDDPLKEIQELTVLIKNDITALNVAVSDLQTLQNIEIADGNYSEDRVVHSTAVCDDLKNKLMGATKKFQDVLTARTENIKAHENRRQIFSTNITRENPLRQQTKTAMEPPPWSSPSKSAGNLQQSESSGSGVQVGNQLRRRLAADGTPSNSQHIGGSMLQQVVPQQETFSQNRAVALQSVESTITELSGIFTNLATMVAHQGELAIRIDDNMEETLSNVEGARGALLKHLNQISSNRGLMIKIFIILIIFLIIFLFFLA